MFTPGAQLFGSLAKRSRARAITLVAVLAAIFACAVSAAALRAGALVSHSVLCADLPRPAQVPGGECFSILPAHAPTGAVERRRSGSRGAGKLIDDTIGASESGPAVEPPRPRPAPYERGDFSAPQERRRTPSAARAPPLRAAMSTLH